MFTLRNPLKTASSSGIRRITEGEYNKRFQRYRIEQNSITEKLKNLHTADEDYYTTVNYILNLSKRIPELFESSKPEIKRNLINLVLSNPTLNDVNVCATIRKPFNRWAKGPSCTSWGQLQDVFRNPTNEFKEEILTFNAFLKSLNIEEFTLTL